MLGTDLTKPGCIGGHRRGIGDIGVRRIDRQRSVQ
jgi:hypothetical protein